jgi:hypothetical protein
MNLKNIGRDSFFVDSLLSADKITWTTTSGNVANSGTVNQTHASVFSTGTSGAGGTFGVGCLMAQPLEERVPYRVKAYVPTNDNVYLGIGYAPATPTGDDTPQGQTYIHLIGEIDEIFMIDYNATYASRALMFSINSGAVAISNVAMSVQKLDVSPPQFGMAIP